MKNAANIISREIIENNIVNKHRISKQHRKNKIHKKIPDWHSLLPDLLQHSAAAVHTLRWHRAVGCSGNSCKEVPEQKKGSANRGRARTAVSLLLVLFMCTLCLTAPQQAAAADNNPTVDINNSSLTLSEVGDKLKYKVGSNAEKTYTGMITVSGTTKTNTITVESGSHTIILDNVIIDVSGTFYACAFKIADNNPGNVTVILADDTNNTLKSGGNCAGLQKKGAGDGIGKLTIEGGRQGTGTLTATGGGWSAGIGGGSGGTGNKITIEGGNVTAKGGVYGAGIGGGGSDLQGGAGSNIMITGGNVIAEGGQNGSGIGGGWNGAGSDITIEGGRVTATGGNGGAGIGGGKERSGSNITIKGGSVKAVAGEEANAIGGGNGMPAVTPTNGTENDVYLTIITVQDASNSPVADTLLKSLTVSGGYTYGMKDVKTDSEGKIYVYLLADKTVTQASSSGESTVDYYGSITTATAEGILSAATVEVDIYNDGSLTLSVVGGKLQYKVGNNDAKDYTGTITVSGTTDENTITVASGSHAIILNNVNIDVEDTGDSSTNTAGSAAFKIDDNNPGDVTVILADDSINKLKSGVYCAGLQKNGTGADIGTLTIKGAIEGTGTLYATGGSSGAGIGGGQGGAGNGITFTGGRVIAKGGCYGAGIGGGQGGVGSDITITCGSVNTTGGEKGAGIGGGQGGAGSKITIEGGIITATGGIESADIGGGGDGEGSKITIEGGSVTATGGQKGARIGGGVGYSAVTPTNGTDNVYLTTITVQDASDNPVEENLLKSLTVSGGYNYGMKDVKTDSEGKIYVYLPAGKFASLTVDSGNKIYNGGVEAQNDNTGAGILHYADGCFINDNSLRLHVESNNNKQYSIDNGTTWQTYNTDTFTVAGTGTAITNTITVESGSHTIMLNNVNIDVSCTEGDCAFKIADNNTGNVTVIMADGTDNTLKSGYNCAGLQKNGAAAGIGMLTIKGGTLGTGSLTAIGGGWGAGIGGGSGGAGNNITIESGSVTAKGGDYGAGIGGGGSDLPGGVGSNIKIIGGNVIAEGGENGSGIGGGYNGAGSDITIEGGRVTATSRLWGAGIGGGAYGAGSAITITGGCINATGGVCASGIGGGQCSEGSNIKITGGSVVATSGIYSAGIGGGELSAGRNITIEGGNVTATGGDSGAGIGGGEWSDGSAITITGGSVKATGGKKGSGIGGGYNGVGSDITIKGGNVIAKGGDFGAGIGGGRKGAGSDITIEGGSVRAIGGLYGSGIGGGGSLDDGIGGSSSLDHGIGGAGSNIMITGGSVTATGGYYGSGIGGGGFDGGNGGAGSNITIKGGSVKAVAGEEAYAIGGGNGMPAVTPTNGTGNNVYLTIITVQDALNDPVADTFLEALTVSENYQYYMTDVKTDTDDNSTEVNEDGKIYVYLPEGKTVTQATSGTGESTVNYYGSITAEANNLANGILSVRYKVTLTPGTGYTLSPKEDSENPVTPGGSFCFMLTLASGYTQSTLEVKTNGNELEANSFDQGTFTYTYTIDNITEDQTVTVAGVAENTNMKAENIVFDSADSKVNLDLYVQSQAAAATICVAVYKEGQLIGIKTISLAAAAAYEESVSITCDSKPDTLKVFVLQTDRLTPLLDNLEETIS